MNVLIKNISNSIQPENDSESHSVAGENSSIVRIEAICKSFGGLQALWNISFDVRPYTVQGLIGPNGAGKTTLFNLIAGAYYPDKGRIFFDQIQVQGKRVHDRVKLGIARTFQNVELFESMTVIENVLVGQYVRTRSGFWSTIFRMPWTIKEEQGAREEAKKLLNFVGLEQYAEVRSSDLPFGWQRLLEIARALASKPKILLLDEPAAGLNAVETKQLGELIKKIRDQGVTILIVEHDMSLAMDVSDRIAVLNQGRLIAEGTPREIQSHDAVMAAYLGGGK
ncbi:MAG: ABC transporter ATP-binding protein [Desulfobacterales bacterium]|nr:ABC transporter ATP-binding protein [Desulfobacterales bacterium]